VTTVDEKCAAYCSCAFSARHAKGNDIVRTVTKGLDMMMQKHWISAFDVSSISENTIC